MASKRSRYIRRGESQWRHILEAFAESGLSQAAFCRREGLAVSTFQHWQRRLGGGGRTSAAPAEPAVIDLGTLGGGDRPGGWEVEIALGDGVSLRLRRS